MGKLKVGFNISPLKNGHKFRGFGYYTKNLLNHLKSISDLDIEEFEEIGELRNVDLVHYPFFDLFQRTLPFKKKFPTLVTVGDVTPLIFDEQYPPGIRGKIRFQLQKIALKKAAGIITISETSKKDIEKYLGVPKSKIFSVYLAANEDFKKIKSSEKLNLIKKKYSLPDKFALFVGNVNWNKNLVNMAKACIKSGINLYLVGKSFEERDNLNHPELKSYKEFLNLFENNPQIHIIGFVSDEELIGLYNLATASLLPSFYEGFGLTILEAQSCGSPVITSNISSMPEVAGKGAVLIDPNSVDSISGAIDKVMNDQSFRERLINFGFKNVKRFSWDQTAKLTAAIYHQITAK